MMENIKNIVDAMSWLAETAEINNREVLSRALQSRMEIHSRLLKEDSRIAQHFYEVSFRALELIKGNL